MPVLGPIRVRLGAVRALLDQHAGTPRHLHMSQAQSNAVLAMVRAAGPQLGAEDRATLSELVGAVQWFDDHGLAILRELTDVNVVSAVRREKQQQYLSFIEFFTEDNWDKMLDPDAPSEAVKMIIINRLIRLGGTNVCEYTAKMANSLWMMLTEKDAENFTYFKKKSSFHHFKAEYRRVADKSPKALERISQLPMLPEQMAALHPAMYSKAFTSRPGDGPRRCPLDAAKLRGLDDSYKCRGGVPPAESASSHQLALVAPQGGQQDAYRQMLDQQGMQLQALQGLAMQLMRGAPQRAGNGDDILDNLTLLNPRRGGGRPSSHHALPPAPPADWMAVVTGGQRAAAPDPVEGPPLAPPLPPAADSREGGEAGPPMLVPGALPQAEAKPRDSSGKKKKRRLKDHVQECMDMMEHKRLTKAGRGRGRGRGRGGSGVRDGAEDSGGGEGEAQPIADRENGADSATAPMKRKRKGKGKKACPPAEADDAKKMKGKGMKGKGTTAEVVADTPARKRKDPKAASVGKGPKAAAAPLAVGALKNFKYKQISWSDLVVITKALAKKTTRGSFTSKAYDTTKRRATVAKVPKQVITAVARQAYKDAAAAWDAVWA